MEKYTLAVKFLDCINNDEKFEVFGPVKDYFDRMDYRGFTVKDIEDRILTNPSVLNWKKHEIYATFFTFTKYTKEYVRLLKDELVIFYFPLKNKHVLKIFTGNDCDDHFNMNVTLPLLKNVDFSDTRIKLFVI